MPKSRDNADPNKSIVHSMIAVRDLKEGRKNPVEMAPGKEACAEIARRLGLEALKKLRFTGSLSPLGKSDWRLDGKLGATVVQACVVTGEPVTTRLDFDVTRTYLRDYAEPEYTEETEFDGDEEAEPLESEIDIAEVAIEALALELPQYPRSDGAELGEAVFTAPGVAPLRDQDLKPFAALAGLKDKLEK